MRISDWSSDVCSSDLTHLRAHAEAIGALVEVLLDFRLRRIRTRPIGIGRKRKTVQAGRNIAGGTGIEIRLPGATEACCLFEQNTTMSGLGIGRASWRERMCSYGEKSGVRVDIK